MTNLTQHEIAERCDVSQPYINNIIKGRRTPSPDVASRLEAATGKHRLYWLYPGEYDEAGNRVCGVPAHQEAKL